MRKIVAKCAGCGFEIKGRAEVWMETQICGCGRGKGRWTAFRKHDRYARRAWRKRFGSAA